MELQTKSNAHHPMRTLWCEKVGIDCTENGYQERTASERTILQHH